MNITIHRVAKILVNEPVAITAGNSFYAQTMTIYSDYPQPGTRITFTLFPNGSDLSEQLNSLQIVRSGREEL
jgi:hypothetical protein